MDEDKEKEIRDKALYIAQSYVNKIQEALNPIKRGDIPFIAFALYSVLRGIEHKLDSRQLGVYEGLKVIIRSDFRTRKHGEQDYTTEAEDNSLIAPDRLKRKNTKRE